MSVYREYFVSYHETVKFDSKPWVLRQNRETWQVWTYTFLKMIFNSQSKYLFQLKQINKNESHWMQTTL